MRPSVLLLISCITYFLFSPQVVSQGQDEPRPSLTESPVVKQLQKSNRELDSLNKSSVIELAELATTPAPPKIIYKPKIVYKAPPEVAVWIRHEDGTVERIAFDPNGKAPVIDVRDYMNQTDPEPVEEPEKQSWLKRLFK